MSYAEVRQDVYAAATRCRETGEPVLLSGPLLRPAEVGRAFLEWNAEGGSHVTMRPEPGPDGTPAFIFRHAGRSR